MKVSIYTSQVNSCSNEHMLSTLRARSVGEEYVVITPDRCNLIWEQKLFDLLQVDSLFDVDVITLSRFTRKILKSKNVSARVLTMQGGVSIVQKILIENKDKLLSFGKSYRYKGFSRNLFETISMFKSCYVAPEDIDDQVKSVALQHKLHDIKLVYSKYEEYLQDDYTDSFNQLNLLAKVLGDEVKNTHFYFVGFDDFTKQQYNIISALVRNAKSVNFATAFSTAPNKNIYLNNIYFGVKDICKTLDVEPEIIKVPTNLTPSKQFIADYAFAYSGKANINDYVKMYSYDIIDDEIQHTIREIKLKVINDGLKYSDFAILVPDYDTYEARLTKALDEYNINYFVDKTKHLSDVSSFAYLQQLLELPLNYNRENMVSLLHNEYLGLAHDDVCNYETYVNANGLNYNKLFNCDDVNIVSVLSELQQFVNVTNCSVGEYIDNFVVTLDKLNFADNFTRVMDTYKQNDVVEYRTLNQTMPKLRKVLDELKQILGRYECDYATFVSLVTAYFENTTIAMPPITTAVFVGDQVQSYLSDVPYVYMLGVNEGKVPAYNGDLGLITDDEINVIPHNLNPTVAFVNKKRKFKVFDNLFTATKQLTLSYVKQSVSGEPMYSSSFLINLHEAGEVDCVNGSNECDVVLNNTVALNVPSVVFNNFNLKTATRNFVGLLKIVPSASSDYVANLGATLNEVVGGSSYVQNYHFKNLKPNLTNAGKVYFTSNKSSISQIQKYYECPYKHFATYGLKLKEVETDKIRPLDYGNIIHRFLELSVKNITDDVDIEDLSKTTIDWVLTNEFAPLLNNPSNNYSLRALRNECVRILKAIKHQMDVSKFKPVAYELPFGGKNGITVTVNDKKVVFSGVIDRVDVYDNYFRIVDYKTGNEEFSDFGEVKLGVRLQLIMYLYAYNSNGLQPAGAFYLPIRNDYATDGVNGLYKLRGVMLDSLDTIFAMDTRLSNPSVKSDVINVATSSKGAIINRNSNLRISEQDFDKLTEYVYNMLVNAVDKILQGDITPKPFEKSNKCACNYCPYMGMCNFNNLYGNEPNIKQTIKTVQQLVDGSDDETND